MSTPTPLYHAWHKIFLLFFFLFGTFVYPLSASFYEHTLIQPDSFPLYTLHSLNQTVGLDRSAIKKKWKIGLSVGSISGKSSPLLHLLTDDVNEAISSSVFISYPDLMTPPPLTSPSQGITFIPLYLVENYQAPEKRTNYPLFRINIERSIFKNINLKTGISMFTTNLFSRNIRNTFRNTDFKNAALFGDRGDFYLFELGANYRFSSKRLKPYIGLSSLFNIAKTTYRGFIIYDENKTIIYDTSYEDLFHKWYFNFFAFNFEAGINYELSDRIEMGLDVHSFGAPFYRDFTIPRTSLHFNYLF